MDNEPLKGMSMERVRLEELRIKDIRLWMSQSCCSLGFLSQNSLDSSLHFMGIRVFIVGYVRNVKRHFLQNRVFWRLICDWDELRV